jgi:hypothetical protein
LLKRAVDAKLIAAIRAVQSRRRFARIETRTISISTTSKNYLKTVCRVESPTSGLRWRSRRPVGMKYIEHAKRNSATNQNAGATSPLKALAFPKPDPSQPAPNIMQINAPRPARMTSSARNLGSMAVHYRKAASGGVVLPRFVNTDGVIGDLEACSNRACFIFCEPR